MRYANQFIRLSLSAVALATALSMGAARSSFGSVTVLSGGDSTDGYLPASTVIYAYNAGPSANVSDQTVQGVPFLSWGASGAGSAPGDSSVTVAGNSSFTSSPLLFNGGGSSANDQAIGKILNEGFFAFPSTMTLSLGGLTPGKPYQVDILVETNNDTRSEHFVFAGATTIDEGAFSAVGSTGYDVKENLAPDVSGNIVVSLSGSGNPFLNGFSVTYAPEPASLGLLGMGGLMLLRRRRR